MGDGDRVVEIAISKATATVSQKGFGLIAVCSEFAKDKTTKVFNERVREYGGPDEMKADGWTAADPAMKAVNAIFMQKPAPTGIVILRKDAGEGWDAALTAARLESDDWYGLIITSRVKADQDTAAGWAEANGKLLGLSSSDAKILDKSDSSDIGSSIKSKNLERSFTLYHPAAGTGDDPYADAAWLASRFPYNPGKSAWKFVTLKGVPVYGLTTDELKAALGKNVNIYTKVKGLDITEEGVVGSGEYIDVIRGIDWLDARMGENIFQLKKSASDRGEKISYEDSGISQIDSVMKETLELGVENKLLAADPAPVTSVPLAEDVSVTDKGKRTLSDATFETHLAGAIYKTIIKGSVAL